MFLKHRSEPLELRIMRYLYLRMRLSSKEVNRYFNLVKGYIGEQKFDVWLESLSNGWIILNDLLLEINNTIFQIDSLLFSERSIYLIEVKNFEGDFYIENERWYTLAGKEIKNPLDQLDKNESLLRQLLQELGISASIKPYLIFVNPDFHLYQASMNLPIIYPTQLNRFFKRLNEEPPFLEREQLKIAEKLMSLHLKDNPYSRIPFYNYDQLKKGTFCYSCHSFDVELLGNKIVCNKCYCHEDVEAAILRIVEEITILFKDQKITTNVVQEWCGVIGSKKTIRRVLMKNFRQMSHGMHSYYIK
ncbi:nuclease-related domain-containing protein [Pseudoneobacillus rhizosphaerae]|uniref:NERD domain-containing protein n=1 Tax=Pseudoneobacillus rhizosphaerae TaxID=2880968 RepID=A0A9C7LBJ0_9BACI|nr:nuclease-related domain-containing protein [Pseudoneobacillus rhizosphaerae]CAG9608973.1 hypothetical protein NEOCIP111885_02691 [Pseudoneobacillus rhizosphaerae]